MSSKFEGAVALTQNSTGVCVNPFSKFRGSSQWLQHCSVSSPSTCTSKYIRDYFRNGTLPPKDTICQVDTPMFHNGTEFAMHLLEEDRELSRATRELSERFEVPLFGL
jgi:hypothetical protein